MRILDSDHCVAILRGKLALGKYVKAEDEVMVTAISVAELTHGAHRSARRAENLASVNVFLASAAILPFDEKSARLFGALKAQLQLAGHPLDDLDLQIASIALAHHASLVTHNQRHFQRVPGLVLEDWMQAA